MRRSRALLAFVAAVDLAGLMAFAILPAVGFSGDWVTAGLLIGLAALAGTQAVRLPGMKVQITPNHPMVICALGSGGPHVAMLAALATVLGDWFVRPKKPEPIRFAFNLGAQAVAAAASGAVFVALDGPSASLPGLLWPLACATAAYFISTTCLVTSAVAIEKATPFVHIWREAFQWTTVTYFAGLTIAAVLLMLLDTIGTWGLLLALPPVWMLLAFYRVYREKLDEQRARIEAVEAANAALEAKVVERTAEVQQALRTIENANTELTRANEQLLEANRAKSSFLASMSHELRTPLNAIIGFSELIGEPSVGELNDKQRELARDISGSGEHLLNLINDILDLSKIEAGAMEVNRSLTDIAELTQTCTAIIRPLAMKKRIEIEVRCDPRLPLADLDPGMFRGVLVNLLSNAVKFTPEGGRVEIAVERRELDLELHVEDTGIGIAPEDQQRVFQDFFQADGSYTREYQGTGLGLALVKRMVEMHGGSVSLRSDPGSGSRFSVHYPACLVEAATAPRPAPAVRRPQDDNVRRTVMIVEPATLTRRIARNALRRRGYRMIEAADGAGALDMVREQRPDMVLIDHQLPEFHEVIRKIKTDPVTSTIRLVVLSADPTFRTDQAIEVGCDGHIAKPLRLSQLPAQVEACFASGEKVA